MSRVDGADGPYIECALIAPHLSSTTPLLLTPLLPTPSSQAGSKCTATSSAPLTTSPSSARWLARDRSWRRWSLA